MNERQATVMAAIVGGEAWQRSGDGWVVTVERRDGSIVQLTDSDVRVFADDAALQAGSPVQTIALVDDEDDDGSWVVADSAGELIYLDVNTESGWRCREDAEHEAAGLSSRTGERFTVRRLD